MLSLDSFSNRCPCIMSRPHVAVEFFSYLLFYGFINSFDMCTRYNNTLMNEQYVWQECKNLTSNIELKVFVVCIFDYFINCVAVTAV